MSVPNPVNGHEAQLDNACDLWARGLSVIPVEPRGKRPALPSWEPFQHRQPTDEELTKWFGNGKRYNVGIVCGAVSGVVAVDLDGPEAIRWADKHLPPTPMRTRTGKGEHRFYRHGGGTIRNRVRLDTGDPKVAVDVRADNGYVVGPGSVHESGTVYERLGDWTVPVDALPLFNPAWIARPTPQAASQTARAASPAPQTVLDRTDRLRQARAYLEAVPTAVEGQGGDADTYRAACKLVRGFDLSDDEAFDLLSEWNARCAPPWSERELRTKIDGARKYGDEPIGGRLHQRTSSVTPFPSKAGTVPDAAKPDTTRALVLLNDVDLLNRPAPPALVDGCLFQTGFAALIAGSGEFKTFLAVLLSVCIASGKAWLGRRIVAPGPVVYVCGEGNLTPRIRAAKTAMGLPLDEAIGVWTIPNAINLMDVAAVAQFIEAVRHLRPVLIVIDTLARCMWAGDENSAQDMGTLVAHVDLIRRETGAAVLLLHHTRKDGASERGSGALRGAADTMLQLSRVDDVAHLDCSKQKEAPPFDTVTLKLVPVPGTDSCTLRLESDVLPSTQLTTTQQRMLTALRTSFLQDGASVAEWRATLPDVSERTFYRARKTLTDMGYIAPRGQRVVWTGKEPADGSAN